MERKSNGIFHIGSNFEHSVEEVINTTIEILNVDLSIEHINTDELYSGKYEDIYKRVPDVEKVFNKMLEVNDKPVLVDCVVDPDDIDLTYSLIDGLEGMSISDSGVITWTPDVVGEYGPVTVLVEDGGEDQANPGSETFTILVDYDYMVINFNLAEGNNLVSLYSIPPEDQSVQSVFESLGNDITHIIGESQLGLNLGDGFWAGSLDTLTADKGYWLRLNENASLPPVVLVHGLTASFRFWEDDMFSSLLKDRSWYSVSLPLHAPSTYRQGFRRFNVSEDKMAELLRVPIDHLIPKGDFHLPQYEALLLLQPHFNHPT